MPPPPETDLAVQELGNARPALRGDLHVVFQTFGGEPCYVIEDPLTRKYHRVGVEPFRLLCALDGRTTIDALIARQADARGELALTPDEVTRVLHFALSADLLETPRGARPERMRRLRGERAKGLMHYLSQALFTRIPLCDPDRLLVALLPLLGWLFSPWLIAPWVVLVGWSLGLAIEHWAALVAATEGLLSVNNVARMTAVWLVLKLIHELAHGLTSRRYGAPVNELGIMLILLAPLGYVDASASWRLRSKWKRIHVSLAGVYVELALAAIAMHVWLGAPPGLTRQLAFDVMLTAGISSVVVNLNPLMRFDGYYVLTDWLEAPGLYTRAQGYLQHLGKRHLLGVDGTFPLRGLADGALLISYGLAAFAWRIFLYGSLIFAACALLMKLGVLLALLAVALWLGLPLIKLAQLLLDRRSLQRPDPRRVALVAALAALSIYALGTRWQIRSYHYAPAVIEPEAQDWVRAYGPGFIVETLAADGARVAIGQPLLRLRNRTISDDLAGNAIEIRRARIRLFELLETPAAAQVVREQIAALQRRRQELQRLEASLILRAQLAGRLEWVEPPASLPGQYLETGQQVARIVAPGRLVVLAAVAQPDAAAFRSAVGQAAELRLAGELTPWSARLRSLAPQATLDPPSELLTARAGGPLALLPGPERLQLIEPHFAARLELPAGLPGRPIEGRRGWAAVRAAPQPSWRVALRQLSRWVDQLARHVGV